MSRFMRHRSKVFYVAMCGFFLTGLSLGLQRASAEDFAPIVREASFASGGVVILDFGLVKHLERSGSHSMLGGVTPAIQRALR